MSAAASARLLRPSLLAVAAATLANLLLLGLARGLAADLTFTDVSGETAEIGVVAVVLFTVVPMLLGLGLAALVRRRRRLLIALAVLAAVFTLVSLIPPVALDSEAATKVLLSMMHLVAGGAYLVVVGRLLRRPAYGPAEGGSTAESTSEPARATS